MINPAKATKKKRKAGKDEIAACWEGVAAAINWKNQIGKEYMEIDSSQKQKNSYLTQEKSTYRRKEDD